MNRLKAFRQRAELTQFELAKQAHTSLSMIQMAERGYLPGPATRRRIAKALGVREQDIWPELPGSQAGEAST